MHIETLKIFCDLVELRSFSRTAEKHLVSQSAVSQQLAQLELTQKCRLLDRKKRPLELTKTGQLFYDACKDILDRLDKFTAELDTLQKATANRVNVAAIFSIGMHTLPPYVKEFMARYPDVNVHIEYLSSSQIYELVLRGSVDIGLVAVPKKNRNIQMFSFMDEPLVLVCGPEHPIAEQPQAYIHQLKMQKFVAFEEGIPTRILIDNILAQYDVVVQKVMEFDNTETIKRAVEINAGVAILPRTVVQHESSIGTLKAIPFADRKFTRPTGIITRKEKVLNQSARYFIDLLRKNPKNNT